jgi:hypothetical protein
MFAFDRETATIVAVIVCIATTAYLFNEFKKTKNDIQGFKNVLSERQQPVMLVRQPVGGTPVPDPGEVDESMPAPTKPMTTRNKVDGEKESSE